MLRVVVDTNIFVAGYLGRSEVSYPAQIISKWKSGAFQLVMSPQIMREIVSTLIEKGIEDEQVEDFVFNVGKFALQIPGIVETTKLSNIDPDDNMFLAAAYESRADYLVSYDKKSLLALKHFHGTQILSPHLFLRAIVAEQ